MEDLLARFFPAISGWYSRLCPVEPPADNDAQQGATMKQHFRDLTEVHRISCQIQPLG